MSLLPATMLDGANRSWDNPGSSLATEVTISSVWSAFKWFNTGLPSPCRAVDTLTVSMETADPAADVAAEKTWGNAVPAGVTSWKAITPGRSVGARSTTNRGMAPVVSVASWLLSGCGLTEHTWKCSTVWPTVEIVVDLAFPNTGCTRWVWKRIRHLNGLVQDCSNSNALAMELLQSCTKTLTYWWAMA